MVALDKRNRGGKHHTREQEDSCHKDHQKIDNLPLGGPSIAFFTIIQARFLAAQVW